MTESTTEAAQRSSDTIAADIEQRRTRRATLERDGDDTAAELQALRDAQARAMADGGKVTGASKIADLNERQATIRRACTLLDKEIGTLAVESDAAKLTETRIAMDAALAQAEESAQKFEGMLRELAGGVLPAFDALLKTVNEARAVESAHDSYEKKVNPSAKDRPRPRAERVLDTRGRLLNLVQTLRSFAEQRSAAELSPSAVARSQRVDAADPSEPVTVARR